MALNVITWKWGDKYEMADVARLAKAVRDNLRCDHRFHLFTDRLDLNHSPDIEIHPISDPAGCTRSCYCRLRMFDPMWQTYYSMSGKIISLDLDIIIVDEIDQLFAGDATFKILKGANATNPNPFNASVMMLRSGCHADVWNDFSIEKADKVPYFAFPDDQNWIHHRLPNADGWQVGKESGIYCFQKPGWPSGTNALPADAKIVTFTGSRKPQKHLDVPWIRKHWTAAA